MRATRKVLGLCNDMLHARNDMAVRIRLRNVSTAGSAEADRLDSSIGLLSDQIRSHFSEQQLQQQQQAASSSRSNSPQNGRAKSLLSVGGFPLRGAETVDAPRRRGSVADSLQSPQQQPQQQNHEEELRASMDLVRRCVEREKTFRDRLQVLEQSNREQRAVLQEEVRGLKQQLQIQQGTEALLLKRLYQYVGRSLSCIRMWRLVSKLDLVVFFLPCALSFDSVAAHLVVLLCRPVDSMVFTRCIC